MPQSHKFYNTCRIILTPILKVAFRTKYVAPENVPSSGSYILASNHISSVDPITIGVGQKRPVMFMAKAELFKNKILSKFFRALCAFPVERGKHDLGAVRHFEKVLADGEIMGIFIEGTRSKTGDFLPPKNGVSLIAYDTKTPVIPVCITKKGFFRIIHFGKPMTPEDLGLINGTAKELRQASRMIMDNIKSLREQDLL